MKERTQPSSAFIRRSGLLSSLVGIIEKHSQSQIMPLNNTLEYFPMNEQNSFLPLGLVSVA